MSMTTDILLGIAALAAGAAVGTAYFQGLWHTVSSLTAGEQERSVGDDSVSATQNATPPGRVALRFFLSFVVRMALLAGGAIAVALVGQWYHLAIFLLSVVATRTLVISAKERAA